MELHIIKIFLIGVQVPEIYQKNSIDHIDHYNLKENLIILKILSHQI